MHYDMTGSVPPLTTWRLAIKKLVPAGTGKRVRRLKYYVVKTRFGTEALRNAVLDWQYGGYCGGRIFTRFPETGAHTTVSTDYYELERVFGPRGVPVRPDDVLVDVGCGKGRILNYWLRSGLKNKLYGLELDPVFANKTAARLRNFERVTIHEGDAIKNLPQDATLFFLYNPFALEVVERFKARVLEHYAHRLHTIRIVYYGCMYVEAFENDPNWNIQMLDHLPLFCRSALITPKL
jgi:SAM-dependent methyltransferase